MSLLQNVNAQEGIQAKERFGVSSGSVPVRIYDICVCLVWFAMDVRGHR